jgi:cysteine-S-conjugate beta-lyase
MTREEFALSVESLRARRGIKWRRFPESVLPAWVADMDFGVAEPVQRAVERVVEQRDYGYPERDRVDRLDAAFAVRMRQRFGWEVDPALVLPIVDLIQGTIAAVLAFSEPGDGVALQTPAYPPFLTSIDDTARRRVVNPLVEDGARLRIDVPGLEAALDRRTRILLLCNPHNPSGRVLDREELEAIARLACDRDLIVLSDEIHCDLVYPGHRHVPLGTLGDDVAARTITINSATKGFNIAGLRCGVMHFGSGTLRERFRRAFPDRLMGAVGAIGVDATVAAWRAGQPWVDRVMRRLHANRDRVAAWAAEQAPAIRHHPPEATYLAWLECPGLDGRAADAYEFFLREAHVGLSRGEEFGPGGERCVRLNFATSPEILDELLERMAAALRRHAA